ncbi:MAG: hypothetical protein CHACPFDD_02009 [Phycisphaerae bacterium]|nr:hypothetical protein [Phycisphaerae bacterium]
MDQENRVGRHRGRPRRRFAGFRLGGVLLVSLACICPALGQMRPLAIRGATIFTGEGAPLENATLIVEGGEVSRVGVDAKPPLLARTISGRGKYVTPGLIDVWSALAADAAAGSDPTGSSEPTFNRYADHEIQAALRGGVTAIFLPARGRDGVAGRGALIRLQPGGAAADELVLAADAVMCAALGADPRQPALARARSIQEFRKLWQDARDYREAWDDYKDEVEEYDKKIREYAAKGGEPGATSKPAERAAPARPTPDRDLERLRELRRRTAEGADAAAPDAAEAFDPAADESVVTADPSEPPPRRRPQRRGDRDGPAPTPQEGAAPRPSGETGGDPDRPKKPKEPEIDRRKEALLRVLDGELSLWVEVHRAGDIERVLEIAREFNLRIALVGASGAHYVADKIKQAEAPVILTPGPESMLYTGGPTREADPAMGEALCRAGVAVHFGGARGEVSRHLLLAAAARLGACGSETDLLRRLTAGAADLLGVGQKVGRLVKGAHGDFVVWSANPLSPDAVVERVFIGGVEVYKAEKPGVAAEEGD